MREKYDGLDANSAGAFDSHAHQVLPQGRSVNSIAPYSLPEKAKLVDSALWTRQDSKDDSSTTYKARNKEIVKLDSAKEFVSGDVDSNEESRLVAMVDVPLDFPVVTFGQLGSSFGQLLQVLPFPSHLLTKQRSNRQLLAVVLVFDDLQCAVSFFEYLKAHAGLLNLSENQVRYGSPSAFRFLLNGALESQGELFVSGWQAGREALFNALSPFGNLRLLRQASAQEEKVLFEHISQSPHLLDMGSSATASLFHSLLTSPNQLQLYIAEFYSVTAASSAQKGLPEVNPNLLVIGNVYSISDRANQQRKVQPNYGAAAFLPGSANAAAGGHDLSALPVQSAHASGGFRYPLKSASGSGIQHPVAYPPQTLTSGVPSSAGSSSSSSEQLAIEQFGSLSLGSSAGSRSHTPTLAPTGVQTGPPQGVFERQQYLAKLKSQLLPNANPADVAKWSLGSSFPSGSGVAAKQHFIPRGNEVNLYNVIMGIDTRTTFMIRNIPNKYSQTMLMEFLNETHKGEYDFLYLRIDFRNQCNVGYAFINFIDVSSVITFAQKVVGKKWTRFNSDKLCMLSYANIQGKQALIEKFRNSSVMLEDATYRPKIFYSSGPYAGEEEPFPPPTVTLRRAQPVGSASLTGVAAIPPAPSVSNCSSQLLSAPPSPFSGSFHAHGRRSVSRLPPSAAPLPSFSGDYVLHKLAQRTALPGSSTHYESFGSSSLAGKGHMRSQSDSLHSACLKKFSEFNAADESTMNLISQSLHSDMLRHAGEEKGNLH